MRKYFVDSLGTRGGSWQKRRTPQGQIKEIQGQIHHDLEIKHESLGKRWGSKDHGHEDYGILHRFLFSKIGQLWDDVYREICSVNDYRNYSQNKLIEAIDWNVTRNTKMIKGKVCDSKDTLLTDNGSRNNFYVHPKSGELCYKNTVSRRYSKRISRNFPSIPLDEFRQYHRIKGLWYLVSFLPRNESKTEDDVLFPYDMDSKQNHYSRADAIRRYGAAIRAVSKKQAGKQELRYIRQHLNTQDVKE